MFPTPFRISAIILFRKSLVVESKKNSVRHPRGKGGRGYFAVIFHNPCLPAGRAVIRVSGLFQKSQLIFLTKILILVTHCK